MSENNRKYNEVLRGIQQLTGPEQYAGELSRHKSAD